MPHLMQSDARPVFIDESTTRAENREPLTARPPVAAPVATKALLDWKALQKALVFTKLVYRKPEAGALRPAAARAGKIARSDRPIPSTEKIASVAAAVATPAVRAAPTSHLAPDPSRRHVDAFGATDERLLPWSCD